MKGLASLNVMPPLSPAAYLRRERTPPFPIEEPGCRLYRRARHALYRAVPALGMARGDEILVPAYHHGSEIEALWRAGLTCRFYGMLSLEPDEASLERARGPATRALLLIHYAGFPQDVVYWRRWCDERSLLLIEDAAQAWLASTGSRPVGALGDAAVFCLYKTYGLPDGGALVSTGAAAEPEGAAERAWRALGRRHLEWLALVASQPRAEASIAGPEPYASEHDFDLGDARTPASRATQFLLGRLSPGAAQLRREHFTQLDRVLHDFVPKPYSTLPPGASPFFFPVATRERDRVLAALRRAGVGAHAVWSTPHPIAGEQSAEVAALRHELLALPVHQELTPGDVDRIAGAAYRALTAR